MTGERIRRDLMALGIEPGTVLIVHSSLRSIGWVDGGAATVVTALIDVLGAAGTLAMPAATPQCTRLPAFDERTTPTEMGAIAETFRTRPGTLRSDHPLESVCARGPAAEAVTADHPLEFSEGPGTPFARLDELDAWILLLGVGFNRCTALHHAESLVDVRRETTVRVPVARGGRTTWVELRNVADDDDTLFPLIGARFVDSGGVRRGAIGDAASMLFRMRLLVGFARRELSELLSPAPDDPGLASK